MLLSDIARGRQTDPGGNQERATKLGVIRQASGISRLLGAAKLQSVPGADNPHYACDITQFSLIITR